MARRPKYPKIQGKNATEHAVASQLDEKTEILDFYKSVWPLLKKAAEYGDVETMFKKYGPVAVLRLMHQVSHAKSEKVQQEAAKALMHMAHGTPVQRSINVNRNYESLSDKELDALLLSKLKRIGVMERITDGNNGGDASSGE